MRGGESRGTSAAVGGRKDRPFFLASFWDELTMSEPLYDKGEEEGPAC